jgi:hypothetical protein
MIKNKNTLLINNLFDLFNVKYSVCAGIFEPRRSPLPGLRPRRVPRPVIAANLICIKPGCRRYD